MILIHIKLIYSIIYSPVIFNYLITEFKFYFFYISNLFRARDDFIHEYYAGTCGELFYKHVLYLLSIISSVFMCLYNGNSRSFTLSADIKTGRLLLQFIKARHHVTQHITRRNDEYILNAHARVNIYTTIPEVDSYMCGVRAQFIYVMQCDWIRSVFSPPLYFVFHF